MIAAIAAGILFTALSYLVLGEIEVALRDRRARAIFVRRPRIELPSPEDLVKRALAGDAPIRAVRALIGTAALLFLGGLALRSLGLVAFAAVMGVGSLYLWVMRDRWTIAARTQRQMPDAMEVMANALGAGGTLFQALELAARESGPPLGPLLQSVVRRCDIGATIDDSLAQLRVETRSPEAGQIATALSIQRTTGGNLSRLLRESAQFMREEQRLRADARALSAQARYSAQMIAALPLLLFVVLVWFFPDFVAPLTGALVGWSILAYCVVSVAAGFYLIWRIAQGIERA